MSPVTKILLKAKDEDQIGVAYRIPLPNRFAHVLLDYKPSYTSLLKKRQKPKKDTEGAGTSKKRKGKGKGKGKAPAMVKILDDDKKSEGEVDLHGVSLEKLIGV